jgi:DNA polymerase-3 subunit epsilon
MKNLLFTDCESTGLNQPNLVTLAYCLGDSNLFTTGLYKPQKEIEPGAEAVHGISNEMVKDLPLFAETQDKVLIQKLLDENILVCHNVKFDKAVLENEGLLINQTLCTVELARSLFPQFPNHKLQTLRQYLNLNHEKALAHSAIGDVIILKALYNTMRNSLVKKWNPEQADEYLLKYVS